MSKSKITVNQVISVPAELKSCHKNVRFAYVALRNLFYAIHICSSKSKIKNRDFSIQTKSVLDSYLNCLDINQIKLFENDIERTIFADVLTSFNRNMINKNEHIVLLKNALSSNKLIDKNQVLMLFCHIGVECSLQLNQNNNLSEILIDSVVSETSQKMLISLSANVKTFIVKEIMDIYNNV